MKDWVVNAKVVSHGNLFEVHVTRDMVVGWTGERCPNRLSLEET
jgi:hypothetical protein